MKKLFSLNLIFKHFCTHPRPVLLFFFCNCYRFTNKLDEKTKLSSKVYIQGCLCSEKKKADFFIRKENGWEGADECGKQFTIVSSLDLIIVLLALLLSSVLFFEGPTDKTYSSILEEKKKKKKKKTN